MDRDILLIVTLKSGKKVTLRYEKIDECTYDIEVLKKFFSDLNCDGYIGGARNDYIVNCREIAAVKIKF